MVKFDLPRGYSLILIGYDNAATSSHEWRVEDAHQVCHTGGDLTRELPAIITDICRGQSPWGKAVYDDQSFDNFIAYTIALLMIEVAKLMDHYNDLLVSASSIGCGLNIREAVL
jgi:hypothetical protein